MPSDYLLEDPNVVSLWRFESGNLTVDSVGTNTLTDVGAVGENISDFKEGACCADFSGNYFKISDADLSDNFPLKSTATGKVFSICFWFRSHTTGYPRELIGKWDAAGNKRTLRITLNWGTNLEIYIGYNEGASEKNLCSLGHFQNNRWYHVGFVYSDDLTTIFGADDRNFGLRVWDPAENTVMVYASAWQSGVNISLTDADWKIGTSADGQMDEVIVCDDLLEIDEIDDIRKGSYTAAFAAPVNPAGDLIFSSVDMIDITLWNYNRDDSWIPLGSYTPFNPDNYDGTCTFRWEITVSVATTRTTRPSVWRLVNTSDGDAVLATIEVYDYYYGSAGYYQMHYIDFTPPAGDSVLAVKLPPHEGSTQDILTCSRISILQVNGTKFLQSVHLTCGGIGGTEEDPPQYYTEAGYYDPHSTTTTWNLGSRTTHASRSYSAWKPNISYSKLSKAEFQAAAWGGGDVGLFRVESGAIGEEITHIAFPESSCVVKSTEISLARMNEDELWAPAIRANEGGAIYCSKARLNLYYQGVSGGTIFTRSAVGQSDQYRHFSRIPWNGTGITQACGVIASGQYSLGLANNGYLPIVSGGWVRDEVDEARTEHFTSYSIQIVQSGTWNFQAQKIYTLTRTIESTPCWSNLWILGTPTVLGSESPSVSPSSSPSNPTSESSSASLSLSPSGSPSVPLIPINPYVMLTWSDDGGETWSNEYWRPVGRVGEYRKRLVWRQLGRARDRVFKIAVSDPCKWVFLDAWIDAEAGTSRR